MRPSKVGGGVLPGEAQSVRVIQRLLEFRIPGDGVGEQHAAMQAHCYAGPLSIWLAERGPLRPLSRLDAEDHDSRPPWFAQAVERQAGKDDLDAVVTPSSCAA